MVPSGRASPREDLNHQGRPQALPTCSFHPLDFHLATLNLTSIPSCASAARLAFLRHWRIARPGYSLPMAELHLTIVYEADPNSDWIVASIPEVPDANSQGRTREEAGEMVLDALAGLSELRANERQPLGKTASESLDVVSA